MQLMSQGEYGAYVRRLCPRSPVWKDCLNAFWIGGLICVLGQALLRFYGEVAGLDETLASTAASVTLIFLSALLTSLSLYDDIAKVAGAGTLVPITGFANSVVAPAMEFRSEGFITGTAAKMFLISGPVIVYGTAASVVYGILLAVFGVP